MSLLFPVGTPPFAWEDGKITLCISLGSGCRCSADWEALLEILGPARHPVSRAMPGHVRSGPESPPATKALWRNIHLEKPRSHRARRWLECRCTFIDRSMSRFGRRAPASSGRWCESVREVLRAILLRDGQAGGPSAREGAACGARGRWAIYLSARTSRRRGGFGG
jgi:hypothetical protein